MKTTITRILSFVALVGSVAGFSLLLNCSSEKYPETTDETLNMLGYIRENEEYSDFLEILNTTGYSAFLNTYGTYTLFLPTNGAIAGYLSDMGASSIADIPAEDLRNLVKLHLIEEVVTTTDFNDGKIATPSMHGQYLTTGAANIDGSSSITVNKEAQIIMSNIEVGNGIIHVIDKALRVATNTLAEEIASRPELSILNQAIRATGWDEKLAKPLTYDQDSIPSYVSVLAQTDEVFGRADIHSFEDLKARYSNTGDPTDPEDSLNLFVGYRILPGLKYLADLVTSPSHLTEAPLEVIGVKLSKDTVLINEETFNGVLEKGVAMDREKSDVTASNGVLHFVKGNFSIKKRFPTPVYFDPGDQPEIRQLSSVFRKPGQYVSFNPGDLKDVTWGGSLPVGYIGASPGSVESQAYWGDLFEIVRLRTGSSSWIEFKTPVIIKGTYKVWLTYRTNTRASLVQAKFDGEALSRLVDFREYRNTSVPERELESQGYKQSLVTTDGRFNSRLLGVIEVKTTDRHVLRLEALTYAGGQSWIDVIEFRPVDMDQLYPKFGPNGELVYENGSEP